MKRRHFLSSSLALTAGNAVWTLETPMENLENLGQYVLTTSKKEGYWKTWPQGKPASLVAFEKWAAAGKAKAAHQSAWKEEEQKYQLGEIERSIAFCKSIGLGVKK